MTLKLSSVQSVKWQELETDLPRFLAADQSVRYRHSHDTSWQTNYVQRQHAGRLASAARILNLTLSPSS